MAKGDKRKEKQKPPREARPGSLLKLAFEAYQQGDPVLARRAARRVLAAPAEASEAEARELGKILFPPELAKEKPTAEEVAREIISRTQVVKKAYLFALVGALVIALMIFLAWARS